jgi:hypothetical protein
MKKLRDGHQQQFLKVSKNLLTVTIKYFVRYRRPEGLTQLFENTDLISDQSLQEFCLRQPTE